MLTLRILENISFKTPQAIITKAAGEELKVNSLVFGLTLVEAGKAKLESNGIDMVELMKELLILDRVTDSTMYLNERIQGSEAVVAAYRTGNKQVFIEQAVALILLYLKCRQAVV